MKRAIFAILVFCSCTDAAMGRMTSLGDSAWVQCYSGGVLVYEGRSSGRVASVEASDGYIFKGMDGIQRETSGDCIITYTDEKPESRVTDREAGIK